MVVTSQACKGVWHTNICCGFFDVIVMLRSWGDLGSNKSSLQDRVMLR